ncbi:MAG: NAD-dependent epimerase/dehydratase family protein [Candidatus Omnitrophica bacterium]|nr:NAD-dependent epimerase/dehydratase family protein [Candidatus Omnitrophota bacterium]
MRNILVTGAGGFIAHHLVKRLKKEGCWVRGVDIKYPEFSGTLADEFKILDLRDISNCRAAMSPKGHFDEVYHLAADMGGMGFIHSAECEIMRNNVFIDNNMICAAAEFGIKNYFFSSSACVYRDMSPDEQELGEEAAYPAMPDNEYGWEKLYAERMALAYGRRYGIRIRIARFQNCFGPEGAWRGGREKAPAAMCRKIAQTENGGTIEIWGDGSAIRSYIYIEDMIEAIRCLVLSDLDTPTNIGNPEYISVNQLVDMVSEVAGKKVQIKNIEGPVGVRARNFGNCRIYTTGWRPKFSTIDGLRITYPWIEEQVKLAKRTVSR